MCIVEVSTPTAPLAREPLVAFSSRSVPTPFPLSASETSNAHTNPFAPPSIMPSCSPQWMKPTTLESASATSSSFFLTALCTDFSRPEIGFQSNHSDRRSSTPAASVFNALLTTRVLEKSHCGPSGREDDLHQDG